MKNYLIVGGTKGIGLKTIELLDEDCTIYTISRGIKPEGLKNNIVHYQLDITKDDLAELDNLPKEMHGLIYCPGSINLKPFQRLTQEDFLNDLNQNVLGAVRILQYCLPRLKNANGSSVVLFSTVAAKLGMTFHSSVAVSKAALEGLARTLAAELAQNKVRVNVVAPSLTDTPLAASLLNTPEKIEANNKRHPLQRIGKPEDIAAMTVFLLSEKASWITGQVLHIDGGMSVLK
ncbi:SDR family NAD(P)-dependent oxidoreductase [Dyadobacter subterraneus]|uniref:SDR family oxidoreductase n=1 Tax=Dyadobacter subterraneus TaxID=2773304 RepID=A0ABR9WBQ2_9BACT|nr:SDR family oxidoreductase [Dyadobacter subterraneus]MBE9462915.1 SDR family oxidoreductase [Dyadobacter subterraneus]